MSEEADWKERIEDIREEKNYFMMGNSQSPIPVLQRRKFPGLNYFPPDPAYSFLLELYEHPVKEGFTVKDSKGNDRHYIRWGEFRFSIGGHDCILQAYKTDADEKRLFIPFKDLTSGKETYGAGRYMDLEESEDLCDGKWALDFNLAYNPWCAYNHNYSCPLVPPENWLKVRIEAGEITSPTDR